MRTAVHSLPDATTDCRINVNGSATFGNVVEPKHSPFAQQSKTAGQKPSFLRINKMITIKYASGGELVSDFDIQSFMDMVMTKAENDNDMNWTVSSSLPIEAITLLIAEGKVPHDKVLFIFEDKEIRPNEYGVIWRPEGYCDIGCKIAEKTLIAAVKKRRTKNV